MDTFQTSILVLGLGVLSAALYFSSRRRLREALKRLHESEDRFRVVYEHSGAGMALFSPAGGFLQINPAFERLFGYDIERLKGKSLSHLVLRSASLEAGTSSSRHLLEDPPDLYEREKCYAHKDGRPVWARVLRVPVRNAEGRVCYFVGVLIDVTERRRAEESLRQSEKQYRDLVETSHDLIWSMDRDGRITFINRQATRNILGYELEEMIGRPFGDFMSAPQAAKGMQGLARLRDGERIQRFEVDALRKDGTAVFLSVNAIPLHDAEGTFLGGTGTAANVTARKQAEESFRAQQTFLEAILDSTDAGIAACDRQGVLTLFNRAAREMFHGLPAEPIAPDQWASHYNLYLPDGQTPMPKEALPLYRALQGECVENVEVMVIPKGGIARTILASARPIGGADGPRMGAVLAFNDITERKRLEQQFLQAQKMEAIGRLAGGVAHDFNNLLTVITGYGEVLLHGIPADDPARELVGEILTAAEKAAALTRQLLAFGRKQMFSVTVLNLNGLLTRVEPMLRRLIRENIELLLPLGPQLRPVKADSNQIEQVILNLTLNARDAMPTGGRLTIATANVELDEAFAVTHAEVKPGPYTMVSVSDTGAGMDASTKARLFEPFFTTKEVGRGTGLGLATAYGIIKQSGGYIDVESEPDQGARFTIYLPSVGEAPVASEGPPADRQAPAGGEVVLVVEDQAEIRSVVRQILERSGYTVLEAGQGIEALAVSDRHAGPIHLLVTDMIMPHMSGRELADQLARLRPALRILFLSGYTDDAVLRDGVLESGSAFLQKPFTPQALLQRVRELLNVGS